MSRPAIGVTKSRFVDDFSQSLFGILQAIMFLILPQKHISLKSKRGNQIAPSSNTAIFISQNHHIKKAAEGLIQEHFDLEPSLEKVIWIDPGLSTEIRLLEINAETFPSGMVQLRFPAWIR